MPRSPKDYPRSRSRKAPPRIFDGPNSPTPEVQLLWNGHYHVMVTNAGGGYSRPVGHELLGNFPQAFSHVGPVNAAWAISQAATGHAGRATQEG